MSNAKMERKLLNGVDVNDLEQMIAAVAEQPELGTARFEAESVWFNNRQVRNTVDRFAAAGAVHKRGKSHTITTDLPVELLGENEGPSPLEVALSSLGACVTTTLVVHAAASGIEVSGVKVDVAGDLDLRGFMNLAEVRAGYHRITVTIDLEAESLTREERLAFVEAGLEHSPVFDLFRQGTEVRTQVR